MRRQNTLQKHRHQPRFRSSLMLSMLGLLVAMLVLVACGGDNGGASTPTPTPAPPSAQQLLSNAQAAIGKVTAYHFKLNVQNPSSTSAFTITSADGDIVAPDKVKANAKVNILGTAASVQLIAIGSQDYVTDPATGMWRKTTGLLDAGTLANPQTGVAAILSHIQNPSTPVADMAADGTPCWRINGKLDPFYIAGITASGITAPSSPTLTVTTCIGKSDNLPYAVTTTGIAGPGDTSNTVYGITLSNFNESVSITAPI